MRLVSSELSLRMVAALAGAGQLTLSELGRAVEAPISSTRRALDILEEDGIVAESGSGLGLTEQPIAAIVVRLAEEVLDAEEIVRLTARATRQVEFAGRDQEQLLIVFARGSDPLGESKLARLFDRQADRMGISLRLMAHDDVRRDLDAEPERRQRYLHLRSLFGAAGATFPDRRLHGATSGERLGRPHPQLRVPSGRALSRLRRRHSIRSAKVFGSAVRSDFRSDSDVDVAIELDRKPTLGDLIAIEQGFEELFDRDVDVILESNARPRVREAIEREGVELLR